MSDAEAWVRHAIHVTQHAVPARVLDAIDADSIAACPNFWLPQERVLAGPAGCTSAVELAVCLLHRHVAHLLPADWAGAEFWVQVYAPGAGRAFHFDKDEALLAAGGPMLHPAWSSILYLTGAAGPAAQQPAQQEAQQPGQVQQQQPVPCIDWDGIRQAPTVILQQLYDAASCCPFPAAPPACALVWPLRGQYCLFDGRLGHGVLDSASASRRATLLVNWWTRQPQGVQQLHDTEMGRQLARLPSSSEQQLLQGCSCSSGSSAAAAPCAASTEPPAAGNEQQLPVCRVEEDAQLVDAVLEAHGLQLTGPRAVSAAAFEHPGFVLCPVEPPPAGAEQLQTLAAFVAAGSEDTGSSEEADEGA